MALHLVEVLSFEGCPHGELALELARRVVGESGADAEVREIEVSDAEEALARHFLGSPTIRVDGRDVEPGADERDAYALSCRMYRTESGMAGLPDEEWVRVALAVD